MRLIMFFVLRRRVKWLRPRRWFPRCWSILHVFTVDKKFIGGYKPRVGVYLTSVESRLGLLPGVHRYPAPEPVVKKKSVGGKAASDTLASHLAPIESNIFGKLFNLVAHCCVTRYDDGDPRRPGWFTVKTVGSAWAVQVKDPDGCCQMQAIGNTLDDALALADLLLGGEDAPWEPDPFLKRQESGKKK